MVASYLDYCFKNCTHITGKLTVTKATKNVTGGDIFGATWFSTPTGGIESYPESGALSIYYSKNNNLIGIDVSALFKTINDKYGFNTTARQLSTPIKLIVNRKEVNLYSEVYTKKDGLISQGYKNANDQYTFQAKPNSGDLLNLSSLVGQTVDFEIIW